MRLLSWNIQWGRGADGRVEPARTVAAIRAAGEFDLICLQEVACNFEGLPGGSGGDEVALFAAAFPGYTPVFGAGMDVPDGGGGRALFGNLLLSRLPVGQVFRHMLPAPGRSGAAGHAAGVRRGSGRRTRWPAAHPDDAPGVLLRPPARRAGGRAARPAGRSRGAGEAAGAGKESNPTFAAWPRPASAIVCGDFNCEPGSAEYARMQMPLGDDVPAWRDAWSLLNPGVPHPPSVGLHGADWPDRAYCCDFFFVTEDLAPRLRSVQVLADTPASDHQPVVLELSD
ncbi:endonuclease/exonuclease/phosphatase family protein [Thauera humireducens]|uniref:endonuclease/exonuclease/phosphatase family protein n=1 Tax=Thauera humireducens TaxID=1134435 RepID=UPI00311EEC42